ncbi:hypothetical protein BDZ97DRAFT_1016608 [Flammula alnicola]|nr:hypothetical protein BDZ97DRAFT_1016608 [Flammula alnicola]
MLSSATLSPFHQRFEGKLEALILLFEIDLSNLFSQLSSFPLLRNLEIHTPFIDILRDPSSLERFLFRCSHTIQRLVIHLTSLDEALTKWLSNCAADGQCYSRLQTLIFYPTHQAARVDVVLGFIRFTSTTLTELQVNQRSLTDDEAMIVVNALVECSQLTSLHLNISRFSLALLDNLAVKVPGIKSLSLSVLPDWHGGLNGLVFEELKERSYIEWKVENLSIWLRGRPVNHPTMEAFARCIPSVSSFFETGHIWTHESVLINHVSILCGCARQRYKGCVSCS